MVFLIGAGAVIFLMLGMYFHDHYISRRWEIFFFGCSAACALFFEWFLHKGVSCV